MSIPISAIYIYEILHNCINAHEHELYMNMKYNNNDQ